MGLQEDAAAGGVEAAGEVDGRDLQRLLAHGDGVAGLGQGVEVEVVRDGAALKIDLIPRELRT